MNKSLFNLTFKEAAVYCSFFFFSLFFGTTYAQDNEVEVRHYQRKLEIETLIVPNQIYVSDIYSIIVPDTVYTTGTISVKYLNIAGTKAIGTFYFSFNSYYKVEYIVKNKKKDELMNFPEIQTIKNDQDYTIEEQSIPGRKTKITLSSK